MTLDFATLDALRTHHPAWRLLRSDHAALVASFLHRVFVLPNVRVPGIPCPDIALDADSFSRLAVAVRRVFITENETNFLAFPHAPDAIVIFGAGYGWEALAKARWLEGCAIHYWGDIDTHGFAILDRLRGHFDHVNSFLMDRATLDMHASAWGVEDKPLRLDLHALTPEERALYDDLRDNRIRAWLRLEQEHIGFRWLENRLRGLPGKGGEIKPRALP